MYKEIELQVRIYICGEYENTATYYIDVSEEVADEKYNSEKLMSVMMAELNIKMEDDYGDHQEWEDGNIGWTLETWEIGLD
jgi:hypothetical protein